MKRLLLVCLAGAIGSGARYLTVAGMQRWLGAGFPWGTLTVNLVGSLFIALVGTLAVMRAGFSEDLRLAITVGLLGGLTTYSSFNQDTLRLLEARAFGLAAAYLGATLLGCLASGVAGAALARRL